MHWDMQIFAASVGFAPGRLTTLAIVLLQDFDRTGWDGCLGEALSPFLGKSGIPLMESKMTDFFCSSVSSAIVCGQSDGGSHPSSPIVQFAPTRVLSPGLVHKRKWTLDGRGPRLRAVLLAVVAGIMALHQRQPRSGRESPPQLETAVRSALCSQHLG